MKSILKSVFHHFGYEIRALRQPDRYAVFAEPEIWDYGKLKQFTARAAQFAGSEDQANFLRNFCFAAFQKQPQNAYSRFEIGDELTLSMGVWRRECPGREEPFIRDSKQKSEWAYWADQQRIEPKRTRWRVVLLGESVARGLFYDPHFNLAAVLRVMLESQLRPGKIDVVDLAKAGLSMQGLKACIGQSLALLPDILVIFAGNNWHPDLSDSDIPYVETVFRQTGVPGIKTYLDDKREQSTRSLIDQANRLLGPRNIKIVWVIPERNLKDWTDPLSCAPLLPGSGNREWRELDRQVKEALHNRDRTRAENLAEKMLELDGGTSSVPPRFLAECSFARRDLAAARRYLELCRDAVGWDPSFSYSPRVFSSIQKSLRKASALSGNAVVDLPEIFSRHLEGELPGRRMFLDYCHLTAEGIKVAGAEIASHVLSLLAGVQLSSRKLLNVSPSPLPEIEGRAYLGAAGHNAAYFQNVEIVKYWCDRALMFWPDCAPLMKRLADCATRDLPILMCKSGLEISDLDKLGVMRPLLYGWDRLLGLTFGDAAVASLAEVGIDIADEIANLRIKEHCTRSGPKELTNFFYSAPIPARSERGWTSWSLASNHGSHSLYASAFWEKSSYVFFAERDQHLGITFTYRVRFTSMFGATVTVDVNGHRIAELPAERTWRTRRISVPNNCIVDGLNEISISWPTEEEASAGDLLDEAANSLLAMRLPYFYRIFGEIHTLEIADLAAHAGDAVEDTTPM